MQKEPISLIVKSRSQLELAINLINEIYSTDIEIKYFGRSLEDGMSMLYQELRSRNLDIGDIERTINKKLKENTLTKEEVDSYFGDDRFCNFCWSLLIKIKHSNENNDDARIAKRTTRNLNSNFKPLLRSQLNESGLNIKQRKIELIDCLQHSNSSKEDKKLIMDSFNNIWLSSIGRKINLSWIDKDNIEQTRWCYEYMLNSGTINEIFSPTDQDYFWALAAAIDLSLNPNDLELLMIKMKKAFSQRKYREKNHELKTYSIGMNQSTKKKLNELVKSKKMRIHEVIEDLINNEHTYHFKK